MSIKDPVLLERRIRLLEQRISRLEQMLLRRDGEQIGETEHGDAVYATTPQRKRTRGGEHDG